MNKYKYKLSEKFQDKDIETTLTNFEPEKNSYSWKVRYLPDDLHNSLKTFSSLKDIIRKLFVDPLLKDDKKLRELITNTHKLFNEFRTHIRKNYPEAYAKIKEENITSGSGIEYSTPKSFKKVDENIENPNDNIDTYLDGLNILEPKLREFIKNRIEVFDTIEDKLNSLIELLKTAKEETKKHYQQNPKFDILYSTDLTVDYLDDLIELYKN
jgi:hypothetical protein